jgi:hypothetical protein
MYFLAVVIDLLKEIVYAVDLFGYVPQPIFKTGNFLP